MDDDGADVPQTLVTLDGKGTFHATEIAASQPGSLEDDLLIEIDISKTETSHIPE